MFIEDLIDFFLKNIFFLVILLAGLSRFFKRVKSTSNQNEKRGPKPLPPVSKPFFEDMFENQKPEQTQSHFDLEDEKDTEGNESFDPTPNIQIELAPENVDKPIIAIPHRVENEEHATVSAYKSFQRPTHRQVVDGIIWAEILGPPRSKKPYAFRNRYR